MNPTAPTVAILALQGCVQPHVPHLQACGVNVVQVRSAACIHKHNPSGYILPGGESSTMLRLINVFGLKDVLLAQFAAKPVWGICAGAILMARAVTQPAQESFGLLNITVARNGYGRQLESFEAQVAGAPVSFIRAPHITSVGEGAQVRASHAGQPVWVQHASQPYMATTFHPELASAYPSPMHQAFVELLNGV